MNNFADSIQGLIAVHLRPFDHFVTTPKKGVQSPKAFNCVTSHRMNPLHWYLHTECKYISICTYNNKDKVRENIFVLTKLR